MIHTEIILNQLGLAVDTNKANDEGWLSISSPFRPDKNPSFVFNVNHGGWRDNGTGQSGDIYELVRRLNTSMTFQEVKEFVDGKGVNKTIALKKPAYHTGLNSPFWTKEQKEKLKTAQERLKETSSSELLEAIESHDRLRKETLVKFGCGIIDHYIDGQKVEALVIPYPTGVQVYTRGPNGKLIRMWKGSDPKESFMGTANLQQNKQLLITKSPREMMLLHQELGATFDVIGICSGETDQISEKQIAYLKSIRHNYKRVFVSFDRDTDPAEKIAFGFARHVCDAIGTYKREIRLLNIAALGGPDCKDLTDLIKAKRTTWLEKLLGDKENYYSNYIWNSVTQNNRFWGIDDKGKLQINEVQFADDMQRNGFKKFYMGDADKPTLIQDKNNILDTVSTHRMADYVVENILDRCSSIIDYWQTDAGLKQITSMQLRSLFFKKRDTVLNSNITAIFRKEVPQVMTDLATKAYIYFKNGVAEVSKNDVKMIEYEQLPGNIWRSQILQRSFNSSAPSNKGEFEKFIENIAGGAPDRIRSFRSTLGYLIHTYKNKSTCPAIVLVDEYSSSGLAQGGTGKGLFTQAIKHLRQLRYISGKNLSTNSRFIFMDVQIGDQTIFFDDVKEDFDFEALFNIITDDLQVERKNQNRFTIPFSESPKVVLSTNSYIKGNGSSFRRRQFTLPFSDHYSDTYKPIDEFGHNLFEDWSDEEWHNFDMFMIECVQLFLKEGLIPFSSGHYKHRALQQATTPDFADWAVQHLETGVEYKAHVLFEGKDKTIDPNNPPSSEPKDSNGNAFPCFSEASNALFESEYRSFINWIRKFATHKGWKLHDRKSNGYPIIRFEK